MIREGKVGSFCGYVFTQIIWGLTMAVNKIDYVLFVRFLLYFLSVDLLQRWESLSPK